MGFEVAADGYDQCIGRYSRALAPRFADFAGIVSSVSFCTFEANGFAMTRTFWDAALRFDPCAPDDARMPFQRSNELVELCERANLR